MNVNLMMAQSPGSVLELIRLGNRLLNRAKLDHKYRELAIIRVSLLCGSKYEWAHHVPIAIQSGVTKKQLESIEDWTDSELFTSEEKIILAYTEEVVRKNEVTFSIGYWSMVAKFLRTFQVDIEDDFLEKNKDLFPSNIPET